MAAQSDYAEHGPCGTPRIQRTGFVPAALRYLIRMSVGERRRRLVKDIIRIVIRSREQRSRERRKWKSSSAIAPARKHVSFSAVKSFRKDRREGRAAYLTNPRRQVGTVDITREHFLIKAGGCTQRAGAAHWEQAECNMVQGSLVGCYSWDQCRGQESGTSGFMGGFVADSRMLVCMHLSMWEAPLNPPAKGEDRRLIVLNSFFLGHSCDWYPSLEESCWSTVGQHVKFWCVQPRV